MRKIALLVICLSMMIALVGCGQSQISSGTKQEEIDTTKQSEKTDNKENENTPTPAETKPIEEVDLGNEQAIPIVKVSRVNYSENSRILDNCLNSAVISETMLLSSVRHLPLFRFDSKSDIDKFVADYSDIFLFNEKYDDEIPTFNEIISTYDEDYFSEQCIMCVYMVAGSGSFRYGVKDIQIDNFTICINIEQTNNPGAFTDDMAGWLILVETNKSDIQECTEYDAQFIGAKDVDKIEQLPGMIEYGSFSYEEDKENIDLQLVSVKTEGFVNTVEVETDNDWYNAIERAKAEVDIDYDLIQSFYDSTECVWKVVFSNSKQMGGDEIIYLNSKGVTLLIVSMGYE